MSAPVVASVASSSSYDVRNGNGSVSPSPSPSSSSSSRLLPVVSLDYSSCPDYYASPWEYCHYLFGPSSSSSSSSGWKSISSGSQSPFLSSCSSYLVCETVLTGTLQYDYYIACLSCSPGWRPISVNSETTTTRGTCNDGIGAYPSSCYRYVSVPADKSFEEYCPEDTYRRNNCNYLAGNNEWMTAVGGGVNPISTTCKTVKLCEAILSDDFSAASAGESTDKDKRPIDTFYLMCDDCATGYRPSSSSSSNSISIGTCKAGEYISECVPDVPGVSPSETTTPSPSSTSPASSPSSSRGPSSKGGWTKGFGKFTKTHPWLVGMIAAALCIVAYIVYAKRRRRRRHPSLYYGKSSEEMEKTKTTFDKDEEEGDDDDDDDEHDDDSKKKKDKDKKKEDKKKATTANKNKNKNKGNDDYKTGCRSKDEATTNREADEPPKGGLDFRPMKTTTPTTSCDSDCDSDNDDTAAAAAAAAAAASLSSSPLPLLAGSVSVVLSPPPPLASQRRIIPATSKRSSRLAAHSSAVLSALLEGLPPDWVPAIDDASGRVYYANVRTRETAWKRPEEDGGGLGVHQQQHHHQPADDSSDEKQRLRESLVVRTRELELLNEASRKQIQLLEGQNRVLLLARQEEV